MSTHVPFTPELVEALRVAAPEPVVFYDTVAVGLSIRITKTNPPAYWYRQANGDNARFGGLDEVSLDDARAYARRDRELNPPKKRGPKGPRASLAPPLPEEPPEPTPLIEVPENELATLEAQLRAAAENLGRDVAPYAPPDAAVRAAFERFVETLDPARGAPERVPGQLARDVLDLKPLPHGLTALQQQLVEYASRPLATLAFTPLLRSALDCVRTAQLVVADDIFKGKLTASDGADLRRAYLTSLQKAALFFNVRPEPAVPSDLL